MLEESCAVVLKCILDKTEAAGVQQTLCDHLPHFTKRNEILISSISEIRFREKTKPPTLQPAVGPTEADIVPGRGPSAAMTTILDSSVNSGIGQLQNETVVFGGLEIGER